AQTASAIEVEENGVPGLSALSVADVVVKEYEKLLAAIPTMARHMGKLQLDTETMAEGLEKRVRSLVDGYRELNELVEQAPARVSYAASEYAQALGFRPREPPRSAGAIAGDESGQTLNVEGIHRELFALREVKLALDQEVMPAPSDFQPPRTDLGATRSSRRRGVGGVSGLSKRGISTFEDGRKRHPRSSLSAGQEALLRRGIGSTSTRVDDRAATATRASFSGGGPRRSSDRRVLAEIQVDPDLPLPLPTFHGTFLGSDAEQQPGNKVKGRNSNQQPRLFAGGRSDHPKSASIGGGGATAGETHRHGYFVPGVVVPRQRQSHGLPQELRAISTIPTPERRLPPSNAGARTTATGRR
ncbi:unnamed protein product, partial [Pylaiella littoralis]